MATEGVVISGQVAAEPHTPDPRPRQTDRIGIVPAFREVEYDNGVVPRSTIFPSVVGQHLVNIVEVMDLDRIAPKPACLPR
jgi:hypothetical protein